jgi:small GTP-binding protein
LLQCLPETERALEMLQKKICMLGSFSVGKTSLVRRFVESIFSEAYHTSIGVKVDKKVVRVNDEDVTLVLWDIHGEDVYQKIRMSYLRGMSGYLLVVDGTRNQTLDDALALNERVIQEAGKVPAILVFNKSDLVDKWEIDSARESELSAAGWNILRASAKTGDSVEQVFSQLVAAILME